MKIQLSNDTFRFLRESDSYYIDKTGMLEIYLNEKFEKAVLFARPRRFGKTITMTMFRDFLDIRQDSKKIFDGLKIMKHKETVKSYMNKYFQFLNPFALPQREAISQYLIPRSFFACTSGSLSIFLPLTSVR